MTLIAFGITGDLMRLKIIPALFALYTQGTLPALKVLGLSRKTWTAGELQIYIKSVIEPHAKNKPTESVNAFAALFDLVQGEADDPASFEALKQKSSGDCIFYLSVSPDFYTSIVRQIAATHFDTKNALIILEKPFGSDGKSAHDLQATLLSVFAEEQIYRIDHYLAKKALEDIMKIRFTEPEYADLWNSTHITRITISLLEEVGVEARGSLYDSLGALRDVGQNHLLEVLALLTMEKSSVAEHISRAQALSELIPLSPQEVEMATTRAQYQGYRSIDGVAPNSNTETYFSITARLKSPNWQGVPFILNAGKRIEASRKEVVVEFSDHRPVHIPLSGSNEYEILLADIFKKKKDRFVSMDEVSLLWRFVDPIIASWQEGKPPLTFYP
jgi:glucose-6-phosphate 1-dehydrogenase